jgi:hypothetical protein
MLLPTAQRAGRRRFARHIIYKVVERSIAEIWRIRPEFVFIGNYKQKCKKASV